MNRFRPILAAILMLVVGSHFQPACLAQKPTANSTRKYRIKPDELAAKAGSAVNWTDDFGAALAASRTTGKPVFWYVPTISGTFMDRKPVIDRYMMAGFFSYPEFIDLLNQQFIAVRAAPTPQQQEQFGLTVYRFIEPGFLVLDASGNVAMKIDRITTQHPLWFAALLKQVLPAVDMEGLSRRFRAENIHQDDSVMPPSTQIQSGDVTELAYRTLFAGMSQFRDGKHALARETWRSLSKSAPDHPLTWKAAAEAQGIGPFVRGFEVFSPLPAACQQAGITSAGSAAPAGTFTTNALWERGVSFLLGMQNEQGGYVDSDYDFGGTDSLPNVHVAVTSLVGMALLEARQQRPDFRTADVDRAIERCIEFVRNEQNLNRVDRDEILWADAYRLRFLCRYSRTRQQTLKQDVQAATASLESIQSNRGTWYHEYQNPFVTATALVALFEAKTAGADVDQARIDRGLQALANDRSANGSYSYYSRQDRPVKATGSVPAAAGRMPICEMALWRWGQSDQERLVHAVRKSVEFHRHLNSALKYDNHTSTMSYGGFFFWYDMRSRTEAMLSIADRGIRDQLLEQQKTIVLALPEIDGCFVDSHELGRCYGTAMALICLAMIDGASQDLDR